MSSNFCVAKNYNLVPDNSLDMMHGLMQCKVLGHLFLEYGYKRISLNVATIRQ